MVLATVDFRTARRPRSVRNRKSKLPIFGQERINEG